MTVACVIDRLPIDMIWRPLEEFSVIPKNSLTDAMLYTIPYTAKRSFPNRILLVLHPPEQGKPTEIPLFEFHSDSKEVHCRDGHDSRCHHPTERLKPAWRSMSSSRQPIPSQTDRDGNKQSACRHPSIRSHEKQFVAHR